MKQPNIANRKKLMSPRVVGFVLSGALLLSSCGESDLESIREEALNDALNTQQEASTVTTEPSDNSNPVETVDLGQANGTDENPTATPAETPDETPAETPDETAAETPDETPAETPDETPAETPDETPAETSDETPAETPDETPAETPDETPAETPSETPSATPAGVDLGQYDLVFSDEFQGATLDSRKWNSAMQWGPDIVIYNQQQYYVDVQNNPEFGYDPFSFDGEHLTITAQQTPEALRATANEQPWLSGTITTTEHFDLTYGYIEARMDVQGGQGLWPAFWALSSDFEGLKPELFIMEHNGANPNNAYHNYNYQDSEGNLRSPGQWEVSVDGLEDGFHTFGILWSPGEFLFYIDGQPRYRITGENVASQDMYLILNLALGGIWAGATDSSTPESPTFVIDYVRAYQRR